MQYRSTPPAPGYLYPRRILRHCKKHPDGKKCMIDTTSPAPLGLSKKICCAPPRGCSGLTVDKTECKNYYSDRLTGQGYYICQATPDDSGITNHRLTHIGIVTVFRFHLNLVMDHQYASQQNHLKPLLLLKSSRKLSYWRYSIFSRRRYAK